MNGDPADISLRDGAAQLAQAVYQDWNSGHQDKALARLGQAADRGQPWAVSLMVWLLMQQGIPGYERAMPYARQAQVLGMPWVAANLFNNMIGNVSNAPQLLEPALALLSPGPVLTAGIDPVGQGWNMMSQNRPDVAVRLMATTASFPSSPDEWEHLMTAARTQSQGLSELVASARSMEAQVQAASMQSIESITKHREDLETKAKQAGLLVSSVNSEAVNTLFDADAERNAGESRTSWRWGIAVLVVAAAVAVLPLVLHYFGMGPDYSSAGLLGAHAGSTAALGAVAGVLLARARGRDRAHQRARDISTAMGTMISYSNQIQDEVEKQRFMLTMGQLVLQAHLQGDASPKEESLAGLAALLSVMRQPSAAT
jgi:hypothetical protein